ncbi:uncharacterized protein, partial [Haliotis asinina]|uniref:uncharacterized protein n=1 Tax=Haliotis asinina TaxID=109174 RepID=UPI0035325052
IDKMGEVEERKDVTCGRVSVFGFLIGCHMLVLGLVYQKDCMNDLSIAWYMICEGVIVLVISIMFGLNAKKVKDETQYCLCFSTILTAGIICNSFGGYQLYYFPCEKGTLFWCAVGFYVPVWIVWIIITTSLVSPCSR